MAKKQRKYDMEYKIQAVKLAKELGGARAAAELGIPENTMYAWTKAARDGRLDIGSGSHTPQTVMNLAEELLKTGDGVRKGKFSFYCRMLKITRRDFINIWQTKTARGNIRIWPMPCGQLYQRTNAATPMGESACIRSFS